MISVVKAAGATVANGTLQLVYQNDQGILTDVYAASYQIWDADFVTQKFPVSPGRQTLAVTGASRVGPGRYNATWTSSAETIARYGVRWFLTPNNGDAEISFDQDFELVPAAYKGPHYCGLQDLRDEGLSSSVVTDAQAQKKIVTASRYVDIFTGRSFGPTYRVFETSGSTSRAVLLEEPIVALEKVVLTFDSIFNSTSQQTDPSSFKVYNRHLSERLLSPDDRESPKIEFIHGDETWGRDNLGSIFMDRVIWPSGVRNIQLTGLFGYTEPDPSYTGQVPDLIREATKMLVFANPGTMSLGLPTTHGSVTKERTRDQEVNYSTAPNTTMSGTRAIDVILAGFRRPPRFRAV